MSKARVTGGKKLSRFIKQQKKLAKQSPKVIDVGFHDRNISRLAIAHEFGEPGQKLPERPAFRSSLPAVKTVWQTHAKAIAKSAIKPGANPDALPAALALAGAAVREVVKSSYLDFHGEELSERQKTRKEGTEGEGRQLVGGEGPKLIEHIEARLDGVKVPD